VNQTPRTAGTQRTRQGPAFPERGGTKLTETVPAEHGTLNCLNTCSKETKMAERKPNQKLYLLSLQLHAPPKKPHESFDLKNFCFCSSVRFGVLEDKMLN
jgi:hypothetical protein